MTPFQIILSSVVLSALVSAIIAPYIKWGIEKRRKRQENRQALINEVREFIQREDFSKGLFRKSELYSRVLPYLTEKLNKKNKDRSLVVVLGGNMTGDDFLKQDISTELNNLEKKWKFI